MLFLHTHTAAPIGLRDKRVTTTADLKGLRIRAPAGGPTEILKALGATPVTMSPTEIYESVQKGTVDGYVIDWQGVHGFRLYEVSEYIVDCNLYVAPFWVIVNKSKWDSLPPDVQKAITEVSGEFGAQMYAKAFDDSKAVAVDAFKNKGGELISLPADEEAKWQSLAQPIWDKWVKGNEAKGSKDILQKAQQLIKEYSK